MILGTVTARSSLKTIIQFVQDDFGITITPATAKLIRNAKSKGCLVWANGKISTTDSSRIRIVKRADGVIESSVPFSYAY
jgi:hypothetical protein